ncbi:MAG: hypothetical protein MUE50_13290 [Pirellulaceae bacterium]|nr:hypothetical protein [Pirellulaceae bacterium]
MNGRINERLEVASGGKSAILIAAAGTPARCRATAGLEGGGSEQGSHKIATLGFGTGIRTRNGGFLGDGIRIEDAVVHDGVPIEDRIIPSPPAPHAPRIAPQDRE